ncbi:MAG: ankyrin repeat domain-containing protein [Acidobacteriaceae bacterium]|nr:ankyrin repeat domain-containing protein [Acidobacteriaceae bacterium]
MLQSLTALSLLTLASWAARLTAAVPPPQSLPKQVTDSEEHRALGDALHAAVRLGQLDQVESLTAQGADVNARDALGSTPLLDAAWSGNTEIANFLLAHGADANAIHTEARSTPLYYAVIRGRPGMVKLLLGSGARVDLSYREGQTALHLACARGNLPIVESLLSAQANAGALNANGNTPLDEAVLHGQASVVPVLLSRGADPKRLHPLDGRGPLHEACIKGVAAAIQPLVDAGADPVQRDRFGQSPLDLALAYKNLNVVAALLGLGMLLKQSEAAAEQAMESATLRGQTEIVRMLIDSGFDIRKPTPTGSTYLHDAALKGQKKTVQLLLDRGARVDSRNQTGGTPLHDAALGGNADVIALLLDRGAEIDARDSEDSATPLMLAASLGRSGAVALLLARGANPALRDRAGHTALERAKGTDDEETVKLLETALASKSAPPRKIGE